MNTMDDKYKKYFNFDSSELFIGLTGPLGTDLNIISKQISRILSDFGYANLSMKE
jgi:hypothetical protein